MSGLLKVVLEDYELGEGGDVEMLDHLLRQIVEIAHLPYRSVTSKRRKKWIPKCATVRGISSSRVTKIKLGEYLGSSHC